MAMLALPAADIRGYYQQLGIQVPQQARVEASLRCFADPAAHRREDRDASCSVNLLSGAWNCHACGARGGAYDAALAKGHTPRSAIDLMIAHGLIERRARIRTARELLRDPAGSRIVRAHARGPAPPGEDPVSRIALQVSERDISRWQATLSRRPCRLARLTAERGWRYETIRALELGLDRGRITIPMRNAHGQLRGVLRYRPQHTDRPKMLAIPGSRIGLVPHPAAEASKRILLVEGPPDMITARSRGLAAIAVPGDHAWQSVWARLLVGRHVMIVMDADTQGRAAAERIANDLVGHAQGEIVDLDERRKDGYDLTDWLLAHPQLAGVGVGRQLLSCKCDLLRSDPAGMRSPTRPEEAPSFDGSWG
ncbi:MAG TPA: toprim domain-containing protein [Solirubrobacteraceae bacterium]|jgi:GNAT superfamily N-acetyltransferase|nr:toprim domain-containing protein [Solirubrobacteraceae bacterium]